MSFCLSRLSAACSSVRSLRPVPLLDYGTAALPQIEIRRWRKNPIPSRPRQPHWDRLKLLELGKPVYPTPHPTTENLWQDCPKVDDAILKKQRLTANQLESLYAKELFGLLESSAMVGIYHSNSMKYHPERRAWQNARRLGMELKKYNKKICREAIEGTKWSSLLFFTESATGGEQRFVFSAKTDPKALFAYEKKVPEFSLMAAVVENRILDRAGLTRLQNLPSIDVLRGELCSILQMPAQKTLRLLQSNQQTLSSNLSQYLKDQEK